MTSNYITIRDIAQIARRYRVMAMTIVLCIVAFGGLFHVLRPTTYTATLLVDIVRNTNAIMIDENIRRASIEGDQYDGYYRLKADEQMGETVMHWLKTPRVTADIVTLAGITPVTISLTKYFRAHRISPQSVQVVYEVPTRAQASAIGTALVTYINTRITLLDGGQFGDEATKSAQFGVRADAPIVSLTQKPLAIILIFWAGIGVFIAFWTVIIRHSLRRK